MKNSNKYRKVRYCTSNDYYARDFFKDKNLELVSEEKTYGPDCPYCGVETQAVEKYVFHDKERDEKVVVRVFASYYECPCCGSY